MINWGNVPIGAVLPFIFGTYGKTNGESITLTGLAVTDIEIYKGTSITQRASDAGYTLLDTDGIDIDGTTGIHGFSVDTGDNTDAGFFAAGSLYTVVVSAVTVDSQTVNFVAGTFRLVAAESVAGVTEADVTHFAGSAITSASGIPEVKVASIAANAITASSIAADAITDAKVASDVTIASVTGAVASVTAGVTVATGGITSGSFAAGAIDSAAIAASAIGASEIAADAITAAKIADGAIDAATFAAGAINAAAIATGAIDADALAADAVDEILDDTIGDGTITVRQALRVILAGMAGKLSGAATTTVTIRNLADSADVVVATVDANGNRSAVTVTP